jgi:DNA-binding NarL/FixJ family response regulator
MIRVLLVEDHTMVRAGLQRILEQADGIEVVGAADRGDGAVALDADLRPDVVLMDVSMPGLGGIEATARIRRARPEAKIVMLTASTDRQVVVEAIEAGATGYLVKDADPAALIEGVRAAALGEAPLDARAARFMLDRVTGRRSTGGEAGPADRPRRPNLTARETEVLHLVGDGLANKAIARRLGISEKTVKAHLTRVFAELGVCDRTQAALWARDHPPSS